MELCIKVIEARNLKPDTKNAYCNLRILVGERQSNKKRTSVCKNTNIPHWNQNFRFRIESKQEKLLIRMWNQSFLSNVFLGQFTFNLSDLPENQSLNVWKPLEKAQGEIHIQIAILDKVTYKTLKIKQLKQKEESKKSPPSKPAALSKSIEEVKEKPPVNYKLSASTKNSLSKSQKSTGPIVVESHTDVHFYETPVDNNKKPKKKPYDGDEGNYQTVLGSKKTDPGQTYSHMIGGHDDSGDYQTLLGSKKQQGHYRDIGYMEKLNNDDHYNNVTQLQVYERKTQETDLRSFAPTPPIPTHIEIPVFLTTIPNATDPSFIKSINDYEKELDDTLKSNEKLEQLLDECPYPSNLKSDSDEYEDQFSNSGYRTSIKIGEDHRIEDILSDGEQESFEEEEII